MSEFSVGSLHVSNLWGLFWAAGGGGWMGKGAKVFPGERAGLSGDATCPALLSHGSPRGSLWLPPSLELGRPGSQRPRDPLPAGPSSGGLGGLFSGSPAESGFGLCGFPSNKEIPCNPPNLLSISPAARAPPRAPRPSGSSGSARGQQRPAPPSGTHLGAGASVHACECVCKSASVTVQECVRVRPRPPMGRVGRASGAAR